MRNEKMRRATFALSAGLTLVSVHTRAAASPPAGASSRAHAHAVVVGSNVGGPGQEPLRFAESDAEQVASVLRELGHYEARRTRVLLHPDAGEVLHALDEMGAEIRAEAANGEPAQVVFYYSGHARASAINLGTDELPLSILRERLRSLPAFLTIVVLDACQSGAFARVKGAEPAADFSYNSVAKLTQKGLAVMASSTSQELSQESDELRASYFTHHLVTALRGAADSDGDGRVSLDEAYRYAYRRTLASTAATQVGGQHVTFETDLAGQDEVPVTYPAEAKAQLELPAALDGRVLVQHRASGAVAAEVQKAPGRLLRLALVAGEYDAIVGQKQGIVQCRLALVDDRLTRLDTALCAAVEPERTAVKGFAMDAVESAGEPKEPEITEPERWRIEAGLGLSGRQTDGYTRRLEDFGYEYQKGLTPAVRFTAGVSRLLAPHLTAVLQFSTLGVEDYKRSIADTEDAVTLHAYGAGIYLRASADLLGRWVGVYGQAGAGMTLGVLRYDTQQTGVVPSSSDTSVGYLLSGAAGIDLRTGRRFRLFFQVGYDRAPAIANLIGDRHDSGGVSGLLGLRMSLVRERP
jgi:hypothetical protein